MKHRHEIESGQTSTCPTHLMGFTSNGKPIQPARKHHTLVDNEIATMATRIITLIDLAGHEKYLKTTIHGVSSGMTDYSLILVNSRHPPTHMTQHHLVSTTTTTMMAPLILIQNVYMHIYIFANFLSIFLFLFVTVLVLFLFKPTEEQLDTMFKVASGKLFSLTENTRAETLSWHTYIRYLNKSKKKAATNNSTI